MDLEGTDEQARPGEAEPKPRHGPSLLGSIVLLLVAPVATAAGVFLGMTYLASTGTSAGRAPAPIVATPDLEAQAESSFTYSLILSQLLADRCGETETAALGEASGSEMAADITLMGRAHAAAVRRAATIVSAKSCNRVLVEIGDQNKRAMLAGY
jgi:hypothetical protein